MIVVVFGATGMVGQGVLRECLLDRGVDEVRTIVRSPSGTATDAKLREHVHGDFSDFTALAPVLAGADACFFCIGVSAAGMSEPDYRRITYDTTLAAARAFAAASPRGTFVYVTGAGTKTNGRAMWARVKGETEDALRGLPLGGIYVFRPAYIQPRDGIKSKTKLYRAFYAVLWPLYPLLKLLPGIVTSTDRVGRAMLEVARRGAPDPIVESRGINALAARSLPSGP